MNRVRTCALRPRSRRGVVLIIVLVVVVMVALAGFGFVSEMTTEYEAAKINGDLLQAQQVMASAQLWLRTEAGVRGSPADSLPLIERPASAFRGRTLAATGGLRPATGGFDSPLSEGVTASETEWRFSIVSDLPEPQPIAEADADLLERDPLAGNLSEPRIPFGLRDESARLHLSKVLEWETEEPGRGRQALLQLPGMTEQAADGILDWIDSDEESRETGAELREYLLQDQAVRPRNAIPDHLEELLFVRGVTRSMFYGGVSGEPSAAAAVAGFEGRDRLSDRNRGLRDYLTLHSAERRPADPSLPTVDLASATAADRDRLEAELQEFLPPDVARYLILASLFGVSWDESPGVPPLSVSLNDVVSEAATFSFAPVDLLNSSVRLPAKSGGQLVTGPLSVSDPATYDLFVAIEQRVITETSDPRIGRINILQAEEPVLRTLTEDASLAGRIVQQRETLDESERRSTLWLVTRDVIDLATYRTIAGDVTTGGHVYSGEIIVYRPVGGPFLRRKVTISAAGESPRVVDWEDRSAQGLPVTPFELEAPLTGL